MAKNTVQNAKTAARKAMTAVVNAVKDKAKAVERKVKTPDGPDAGTGKTPDAPAVKAKKKKDTADGADVSKKDKKRKKAEDLSVPRNAVGKAVRKGLHKAVDPDSVTTAVNTLGRTSNRASLFGMSVSAVWRAMGYRKDKAGEFVYTVSDAKAVRDGVGLDGVIKDANVKCQFGDGRGRANGHDPLYGGDVGALTAADWKVVDGIVKAAREE